MSEQWEHERYNDEPGLCNHRFGWEDGHHVCNREVNHDEIEKTVHHCVCGATDFLPTEVHFVDC